MTKCRSIALAAIAASVLGLAWAQDRNTLEQIRKGVQAYLQKNYPEVGKLLAEPARKGDLTSSYVMGTLFHAGNGVNKDPIRAYSLLASAGAALDAKQTPAVPILGFDMNDRVRKTLDELSGTLGRAKVRMGNVLRTGEEIDPGFACDYGGTGTRGPVTTFAPESTAVSMVHEICSYTGLKPNFTVRAGNVPNALATVYGQTRYVVYNPSFMDQVSKAVGGSKFSLQSIMAHEVGHHLQGHTLQSGGSRPSIELEADEYSGFIMAKMGASLGESQAAMARIASEQDGPTHPGRAKRLQAIANGWNKGRGDTATRRAPVQPAPTRDPWETRPTRTPPSPPAGPYPYPNDPMGPYPPSSPPMAAACVTRAGNCRIAPAPAGVQCYCSDQYGRVYFGVTR